MADLRATRVTVFAGVALLSTTQDLLRAVLPALGETADRELAAEETLALVATTTARAAELGLRDSPELIEAVGPAILEAPYLYHDFLLGAHLVGQGAEGDMEVDQSVYARIERKLAFYASHFPVGQMPGSAALRAKLPLWMGRISPPALPSAPEARLHESGAPELLETHLRLVLAFAQRTLG